MVSLNEVLSKLRESVFPSALPSVCSSVYKLVSGICSISNRQYSGQHVLEDTDSDEEIHSTLRSRCKYSCHEGMSQKEVDLFIKYFPCFPVPRINHAVNMPLMIEICNLKSLEYSGDVDQTFPVPGITFEQIVSDSTHRFNDLHKYLGFHDNHSTDLFSLIEGTNFLTFYCF